MAFDKKIEKTLQNLIHNKYFFGITLLLVNVGSKYLGISLSPAQENLFKQWYVRCLIFFCVFFTATKDFVLSLFLVTFYYVVFNNLLNEESKICILPEAALNVSSSQKEYENCKKIVKDYEEASSKDSL